MITVAQPPVVDLLTDAERRLVNLIASALVRKTFADETKNILHPGGAVYFVGAADRKGVSINVQTQIELKEHETERI